MKKKKVFIYFIFIISVVGSIFFFLNRKKELTIDEILKTEAYSYLSDNVKEFIKEHYEETGEIYLTEKNKEGNEVYLNPSYIEYLDSSDKDSYNIIPSVTAYVPKLMAINDTFPSSFDLRDVDGKNYVTPIKDQGNEGLCWAYATASLLETHDLITKDKSYDSTAVLFSEKQMDYALSSNGIIGGNHIFDADRKLTEGAALLDTSILLSKRLGGFQDTWNEDNSNYISINQSLEPSIVFNSSKSLYELDKTISISHINGTNSTDEERENTKKIIKNSIYNFGGVLVNSSVTNPNTTQNMENKNDYLNVNIRDYVDVKPGAHALHIIGWDDNYEYSFCSDYLTELNVKYITSGTTDINGNNICFVNNPGKVETQKITGKGAWILKNSWGTKYSYLYVPYDSELEEIIVFADYSEKTWDNSYTFEYNKLNGNAIFSLKNDIYVNNEIINKIKMYSSGPVDFTLYYSEDGEENNYISLGEYSFEFGGINTIDLSSKNLSINNNSKIKINNVDNIFMGTIYKGSVFTNNVNQNVFINTNDYILSLENEKPSGNNFLNIDIKSNVKNIDDNSNLVYKIKKENNEYVSDNLYDVIYNKTYYNIATPIIKIKNEIAKKGIYWLETWYNNALLTSSLIQLNIDFMPINGSGTENDPWQIENVRHFNMIRNAPYDNYILMNDLDFEYDTKNSNGLFYNNGSGWNSISDFYGNFDGNSKNLNNIASKNGLFDSVTISNDCLLDQCGIHDLKVNNIDIFDLSANLGGIINFINYKNTYTSNFNNLSATNVKIHSSKASLSGGIVGGIYLYDDNDWSYTILKIDNWNSEVYFDNLSNKESQYIGHNSGGLIGSITSNGAQTYVYISNAKANVHYDYNDNDFYLISDVIGYASIKKSHLYLNNIIGILNGSFGSKTNIDSNAFIGYAYRNGNGNITINGAKSTMSYNENENITISNYETNLEPYELARSDYSNYYYYDSQYYVYDQEYDGTVKVSFEDRFNHKENTIPTLKQFSEQYAEYAKTYSLEVGETKSVNDLIIKDSSNKKLNVYPEFVCELELCNNVTDSTIISIPTIQNEYQFTGLKSGSTKLILYDEYSGYIDAVTINVMGEGDYHLTLDYNYDDIIDNSYIVTKGNSYGSLPSPSRDGYEFIGWFTEEENGTMIEENTIFNENSDIILYAHWQINNYTVTFDSKGGTEIPSQTINYNGTVIKPDNPTKEGAGFVEWQLNGNTYVFGTPVTENITLTAVWLENKYIITFDSNGGSNVPSQTVDYNGTAIKPDNPTREGYTFVNWKLNGNDYDFSTPVTNSITLVAEWTINKYTVTFNSNGGSNVPSQTIDYNGTAIKPIDPTREGYTFVNWKLNGNDYNFATPVTSNITLVAEWQVKEKKLIEILNDNNYEVQNGYVYINVEGKSIEDLQEELGNDVIIEVPKEKVGTGTVIRKGTESYIVVIKGDVTGDGNVNIADVKKIADYTLSGSGLEQYELLASEVTKDETINIADVKKIADYSLNKEINLWN